MTRTPAPAPSATRWLAETGHRRGQSYAAAFDAHRRARRDLDGEARAVDRLARGRWGRGVRVLDAGCGTGRVGAALARRGHVVSGLDADPSMLAVARARHPHLTWWEADLASPWPPATAEVVVAAGNVLVFLAPGTEELVVRRLAERLAPGGLLVAGFVVDARLPLDVYDAHCAEAGLQTEQRLATWDGAPYTGGGYAVSVHRRG